IYPILSRICACFVPGIHTSTFSMISFFRGAFCMMLTAPSLMSSTSALVRAE
uniref:Uncharacterized protein n=1 Tax=Aegilops tauschii subsp. strangulata TaxID=200361 RepID=A0A453IPV6_AEGTS